MDPAPDVLEAALELDEAEQEEIVEALAADLGPEWEAEIQRRVLEVDAGNMTPAPAGEVFERLERKFERG